MRKGLFAALVVGGALGAPAVLLGDESRAVAARNKAPEAASDRDAAGASADRWNRVKLAVARETVASVPRFFRSLRLWANEPPSVGETSFLHAFDGDLIDEVALPTGPVVHIRGNLVSTLRVEGQSEVVIGGSILEGGRIEGGGITVVHVQGDVDGVVACGSMSAVWIGGDLRGAVLTGEPSLHLHVGGDLLGAVRPIGGAALLYVVVRGRMPAAAIEAVAAYRYTELQIAVGTSELGQGIHRLSTGSNGFVAVASGGR